VASAPSKSRPVAGRVDGSGRLIAADPELEKLQREAGSEVGELLALPQVAAVAELARKLRAPVRRPAIAASADQDIDLWVNATPEGEEVSLSLEGWNARPASGPRLASLLGAGSEAEAAAPRNEWSIDEELRIISLSTEFAELLGVDAAEATGELLTGVLRLEEAEAGDMPLMSALALRRDFAGQLARSRSNDNLVVLLSGELVTASNGHFAGFRGTAEKARELDGTEGNQPPVFDHALDELLRSPIDRIIENAERIVARADGPLSSDYAGYGNDIASAARHLLSVLEAMSDDAAQAQAIIDLSALASEAVIMLESTAEDRSVSIDFDRPQPLRARGQERGVIQILVNLIGNAIRYSPEGATVRLSFGRTEGTASVTISDEGPGVAAGDEQRIFERFERAHSAEGGTGLGLAISRRLARSMGGDVTLDSAPGEGARFTLTLTAP
jgi:signal transduction histidine kinase